MSFVVNPSPEILRRNLLLGSGSTLVKHQAAGGIERTVQDKLGDFVSLSDYGDPLLTATIDAALAASDYVVFPAGLYPPYEFDQDDKTIIFQGGVEFKLPDGTIGAGTVTPVSTVIISGDNVHVYGSFSIDGNLANNDYVGLNTSLALGALHIAGAGCRINGIPHIKNANWVSFSMGSEADQAADFYMLYLSVENSRHYATSCWNVDRGHIGGITVIDGAGTIDSRVRTGSQNASAKKCSHLNIGLINSENTAVFEAHTEVCVFGDLDVMAWKIEDAVDVTIGNTRSTSQTTGGFSAAILACTDIQVGNIAVEGHDGDGSAVIRFSEVVNCQTGNISVTGTINDATDVNIRSADVLQIGNMLLKAPVGNGKGFHFDYDGGYAPQEKITIGNIVSIGHVGDDILIENEPNVDIQIRSINLDASGSTTSPFTRDKGEFQVTLSTGGGSVTINPLFDTLSYVKNGRAVTVLGQIRVSSVAAPTGTLQIIGLPFTNRVGSEKASETPVTMKAQNTAAFSGQFNGIIVAGGTNIVLAGSDGNVSFDVANLMQAGSILSISATYFV